MDTEVCAENHHKRWKLCTSRPPYRQGRKLTAVKVYTINDESVHLLVFGVPSLSLKEELKKKCSKYGKVVNINKVEYPETEQFTDVFHVQFGKLSNSRFAKRKLDDLSFYGGILHVCYSPELETLAETRDKLCYRMNEVQFKLNKCKQN